MNEFNPNTDRFRRVFQVNFTSNEVTNIDGLPVAGVSAVEDNEGGMVCGIRFDSVQLLDIGEWACTFSPDAAVFYRSSFHMLTAEPGGGYVKVRWHISFK